MGYFASRSAAMGPVPAEVVMATFYNFHPRMVRRAIPDAWGFAPPAEVLGGPVRGHRRRPAPPARGVGRERPEAAEAAGLASRAMEDQDPSGRPLFAAHAALGWPEPSPTWPCGTAPPCTASSGATATSPPDGRRVGGCEAHVLAAGAGQLPGAFLREYRGWSEEEWARPRPGAAGPGWVEADGP